MIEKPVGPCYNHNMEPMTVVAASQANDRQAGYIGRLLAFLERDRDKKRKK